MIKNIHFVGIKGVGVAPLAIIAKKAGFTVTGSDIADDFITSTSLKKVGITPFVGFSSFHVKAADLVITTGAHRGFDNPEVVFAKSKGIRVLTQGEAVGYFMKGELFGRQLRGVSVAGCHGKTTTTAIVATILKSAGKNPSWVIGTGDITSLESSGHYGNGEYFVAEADEYATEPNYDKTPKFLWQHPEILIITNIEFDHPDLYKDLQEVSDAYAKLIQNVIGKTLIVNGDDTQIRKIIENFQGKLLTFGFSLKNNYVLSNVRVANNKTTFLVTENGREFGTFETYAIGEHNALNGLAAIITANEIGLSVEEIKKGLLQFKGTKRRLEYKGKLPGGALLYDDYAHHPTEIQKTLAAVSELYKNKKIICIFQPHTYSRTKILFDQFSSSFMDADQVILTKIYASQREKPDPTVHVEKLQQEIEKRGKVVTLLPSLSDVVKYIQERAYDSSFVVITMGAGDIYKIDQEIV